MRLWRGRLKQRNAESMVAEVAEELDRANGELLSAITFLGDCIAQPGLIAGPKLSRREEEDVSYGFEVVKAISRLDIGETVIVKNGTVLAVEAFEGTNEALKRGAALARTSAIMVKVAKPNQDMRFDVPVIGLETIRIAGQARLRVIALEASTTLLLERDAMIDLAERERISIVAR